jgi:hypothetical protein
VLAGLTGQQIAAALVEAMHPDDAHTRAERSIVGRILGEVCGSLGDPVSLARLAAALRVLMGEHDKSGLLSAAERTRIATDLFTAEYLRQVHADLVRIESYIQPLAGLGSPGARRDPAYLTCIALQSDAQNGRDELLAGLVVQWLTYQPDYAMLLVASRPGGGLVPVECNPEIVTLPRVSMAPLPHRSCPRRPYPAAQGNWVIPSRAAQAATPVHGIRPARRSPRPEPGHLEPPSPLVGCRAAHCRQARAGSGSAPGRAAEVAHARAAAHPHRQQQRGDGRLSSGPWGIVDLFAPGP